MKINKTAPPNPLLCDIVHCLEQLCEICNEIVEDIVTLLDSSYVDELDDLVSNVLNNQVLDYTHKDGSECLKKNVFAYQKFFVNFKKNYLNSKKNFPPTKKIY